MRDERSITGGRQLVRTFTASISNRTSWPQDGADTGEHNAHRGRGGFRKERSQPAHPLPPRERAYRHLREHGNDHAGLHRPDVLLEYKVDKHLLNGAFQYFPVYPLGKSEPERLSAQADDLPQLYSKDVLIIDSFSTLTRIAWTSATASSTWFLKKQMKLDKTILMTTDESCKAVDPSARHRTSTCPSR